MHPSNNTKQAAWVAKNKNKIDSLQYLRAFAALWVLLTHVLQELGIRPSGVFFAGQWGVDIFFLLSGFIIYHTTKEHSSWKAFAVKRVFRIYPAYWLALIIYTSYSVVYNGWGGYNALTILQNIIMMPWSGRVTYTSLIVGQAWSTCYELYFYLLMGLILFFRVSKKWILPVITVMFVTFWALSRMYSAEGFLGYIFSLAGVIHILFFVEGIIIAMLAKKLQSVRIKKRILLPLFIISLVLYIVVLCSSYRYYVSLALSPLFFYVVYKANDILPEKGWIQKAMLFLGDASFSIYLIHSVVIRFLLNHCHIDNFPLLLMTTLVVTIALSMLSYYFVEKRFIDLGKNLSQRFA